MTEGTFDPNDRAANMDLLDAARSTSRSSTPTAPGVAAARPRAGPADRGERLQLSQADVLIETRRAADLLGATKMDRPEDIEPNPKTGKVYVMLTNNTRRKAEQVDAANPRADNAFGHIIEMLPDGGDHAADQGRKWEILLKCGDPSVAEVGATFSTATTSNGWFGMPDNCAVDQRGPAVDLDRRQRRQGDRPHRRPLGGRYRRARRAPPRSCSSACPSAPRCAAPSFTPDDETPFVAVQHPGDGGTSGRPSDAVRPSRTRRRAGRTSSPTCRRGPRSSSITKQGGGKIAV